MIEEDDNNDACAASPAASSPEMDSVTDGEDNKQGTSSQAMKGELVPQDQCKSTAMVKFSQVQPVSRFSRIKLHTDLRRPPENWLRSGTQFQAHSTWLKGETNQFSSFNMAGTLPRTVGEVDVISASENIKKLLKIPFSKSQVSMAVHRIGKTLLLDELDLYQHLRTASQSEKNWLKDVLYRAVDDSHQFPTRRKTNETLQSWNLLSKFLHYSIGDSGDDTSIPMPVPSAPASHNTGPSVRIDTAMVQQVPDPPHEPKASEFARHVLWEFEDLRMLIGSDLPIFGGGKYPAVSLRLRDMNSPISVLTGMDYWLDNLMCNVPEIAMCYHLNGIVQKYELLKTEEIPRLQSAQFSPRVVNDIAQNILSFIKSSCTREGHTYWLYKGQNDDVVKLYDLTSLSMEPHGHTSCNPFVGPVALLLYRVAHTMSASQPTKKDKGIICKLLKNCLSILEKDGNRNPQLLASANCLLSHMLVSDEDLRPTPEGSPESNNSEESSDNDNSDTEDENVSQLTTMEVDRLVLPSDGGSGVSDSKAVVPKILWDTKVERAEAALSYIVKGLRCIEYSSSQDDDNEELTEDQTSHVGSPSPQICYDGAALAVEDNPDPNLPSSEPNPPTSPSRELVSYTSTTRSRRSSQLNRSGSDSDGEKEKNQESSQPDQTPDMAVANLTHQPGSWQYHSKTLLLRKARQIYSILAVGAVDARRYGKGLHFAKLAFACHCAYEAVRVQDKSSSRDDKPNPLSETFQACGDCHLLLTHNLQEFNHHKDEYNHETDDDAYIMQITKKESTSKEYAWAAILNETVDSNLHSSIQSYIESLNKSKDYNHDYLRVLGRKLGNAYNEQGVYYRNLALNMEKEESEAPNTEEQDLWRKSYQSFESGILAFEEVNDSANIALLYCNLGQLMRVCAHAYAAYGDSGGEFSKQEKHYYNQAIDYYNKALGKIEQRRRNKPVWDSISWELSTTHFTMATLLQDHPPLSRMAQEQVEKVVLDAMTKALIPCEMEDIKSDRQPIYQYRAATIHHRLASMYHNSYRNQLSQQKQKHTRSLAELHYDKAIKLFKVLDHPTELLRVQLEKVALYEHVYNGQNGVCSRIKSLQSALDELLHCQDTVSSIHKILTEEFNISQKTEEKTSNSKHDISNVGHKTDKHDGNGQESAMYSGKPNSVGKLCNTSTICDKSTLSDEHTEGGETQGQSSCKGQDQGLKSDQDQDAQSECDRTTSKVTPHNLNDGKLTDSESSMETEHNTQQNSQAECQGGTTTEDPCRDSSGLEADERVRLQNILKSRLQFVLLNLIKLHSGTKKGSQQLLKFKKMYALSLSQPPSTTPSQSSNANLPSILQQIAGLHR